MQSPGQPTLELAIDTVDDESVQTIEQELVEVAPQRWPATRDIVTIITIASSAVALIEALLSLRERLLAQRHAPKVTVKNAEREEVVLIAATRADLERLLATKD